jgi:hypothetical protein
LQSEAALQRSAKLTAEQPKTPFRIGKRASAICQIDSHVAVSSV